MQMILVHSGKPLKWTVPLGVGHKAAVVTDLVLAAVLELVAPEEHSDVVKVASAVAASEVVASDLLGLVVRERDHADLAQTSSPRWIRSLIALIKTIKVR
jgi:hypothetical protein